MAELPRPSDDDLRRLVFAGFTGIGRAVEVHDVEGWLDVRFLNDKGEVCGFSLNGHYAALLTRRLVDVLAERADG